MRYIPSPKGRYALFVDLPVEGGGDAGDGGVVRVCNTHLDSLPPSRNHQMAIAGHYLHEDGVAAGLVAGDLHAVEKFDETLHRENGLKDAYLELRGVEDGEDGSTRVYMHRKSPRKMFGISRMDKVLFRGTIEVKSLERFGEGVVLEGDEARVVDRLGLKAELVVGKVEEEGKSKEREEGR